MVEPCDCPLRQPDMDDIGRAAITAEGYDRAVVAPLLASAQC